MSFFDRCVIVVNRCFLCVLCAASKNHASLGPGQAHTRSLSVGYISERLAARWAHPFHRYRPVVGLAATGLSPL
jgi:hypothetical protein